MPLLLLLLCWMAAEAALFLRASRRAAEVLPAAAEQLRLTADMGLRELVERADRRLASVEQRAADAVSRADARIGEALYLADARLAEALSEVRGVRVEAQVAIAEMRGLIADVRQSHATAAARLDYWTDCDANGLCWQGAATDTLLAVRRAALSVDQAMPRIVAAAEGSAAGVQATAQASAQTAENLARITQPGPRWLRYLGFGLGLAAPAAQTALPFAVRSARLR